MRRPILTVGSIAALVLLAGAVGPRILGPGQAQASSSSVGHTITVTGQSRLKIPPDQATIDLGISAHAKTATEAEHEDGTRAQNVINALEKNNVLAKDITTGWFNLSSNSGQIGPNNQPQPLSFTAQTNLSVKVTNLGQVGSIIDEALNAGADQVNNVGFSVANAAHYNLEGYKQALADARSQASALAKDAGVALGSITAIDATTGGSCCVMGVAVHEMAASPSQVPFMPAPQEIDTSITVSYSIVP